MKFLLLTLLLALVSCFGTDKNAIKDAEMGSEPAKIEQAKDSENAESGFVEENDLCICTKEYNPVCGSNGQMYPNPCQAGCDGVKEFTEGECSDEASEDTAAEESDSEDSESE